MIQSIAVYCGSNHGSKAEYTAAAKATGEKIAEAGLKLVYGGGNTGLMGIVANAALEAGGEVIGVMPELLIEKEIAHPSLTELHPVSTMHERKQKMIDLADGFIALPGGIGTLEEIAEAYTWLQLRIHKKPCALLNTAGFYDPLIAMFQQMVQQEFMKQENLETLIVSEAIEDAIAQMKEFTPPSTEKWIERR